MFEIEDGIIFDLKKELAEQCRINGMGAQRELKLMTELTQLKAQNELMREALENVKCENHSDLCKCMKPYRPNYECHYEIADEALTRVAEMESNK